MKYFRNSIVFKSISVIVLLLAVFSVIVSSIGYYGFTQALLNQYAEGAFYTAQTALLALDAEKMDAYAADGDTGDYLAAWEKLDQLCNRSGSTFIYVIRPDLTDYAHITFVFSTIDHDSQYTRYEHGYVRETTNEEYKEKYRTLYAGTSEQELVIRDQGYIETDAHITAMVPVKDESGDTRAILCVQRQMDGMTGPRKAYVRQVAAVLIIVALLAIVGQGLYLHRVFLRPVKKITDEAERFATENTLSEIKLEDTVKARDEIGTLAQSIDQMESRIVAYTQDLTRITAEKERIGTELSLAADIQAAMLPHVFPPFPDRGEFEVFGSMDPAKAVGGDFFDYFLIDDDHLCLLIADVSGKGVPAALFMMASKIILQSVAMLGGSPAEILNKTNEAICSNNAAQMFVTVWVGILEISTGKLTAANAGHEYPAIRRADGRFELYRDKHGFVLGGMEGVRYREYELQMEPDSKLFVYTDGVPEATNANKELFGTQRMLAALNTDPNAAPEAVLKNVRAAVDGFVQDAEQFDDLTMLCVEYKGKDQAV